MSKNNAEFRPRILEYIENKNYVSYLKEMRDVYSSESAQSLYPFKMVVDVLDLTNFDGELGNWLIEEPLECQALIKEVVFEKLSSLGWFPQIEASAQLLFTLTLTSLPDFEEYLISDRNGLCGLRTPAYYILHGTIVSLSVSSKYTKAACYECPRPLCPGHSGNKFIVTHTPGMEEHHVVRKDMPCPYCGGNFVECVQLRFVSEKVKAKIAPISSFKPTALADAKMSKAMVVCFRDELEQNLILGASYSVTVMAVRSFETAPEMKCSICLEANYVEAYIEREQVLPAMATDFLSAFYTKLLANLKITMDQLSEQGLVPSPYISPAILACGFADHIAPSGVYNKLKMNILLALVISKSETEATSSMLVRGKDTAIINRLLLYGSKLSKCSTRLTDATQLKVRVATSDVTSRNEPMVDANPFLLAHNGICYLGDLAKFATAAKTTIAHVLEDGRVDSEPSRFTNMSTAGASASRYQLLCQVWAYASCSSDRNMVTGAIHDLADTKFPRRLLDAFSIVHCTEGGSASVNIWAEDELVAYLLNEATGIDSTGANNEKSLVTIGEWKKFLNLVNAREVKMEANAEEVIRKYFLASRRVRNRAGAKEAELSAAALPTMVSVAKAHAKLSLRWDVTNEDASVAVMFYENYLTARYGISCMNVQPNQHLQSSSGVGDMLIQIQEEQKSFYENLIQFLDKYGNEGYGDGFFQTSKQREE